MNLQGILDIAERLVEIGLIEFKPGMGLGEIETEYRERVSATMQGYLDSERTIASFKNDMRRTTNDAFLLAAVAGWVDGGGDGPMPDSLTEYVNQQVEAQFTFIDDVFAKLKELRKSGTQDEQAAYIEGRADGYTASIQGIYDYARVTAAADILLTFDGPDGSPTSVCSKTGGTCVKLKGQTHKASWWIEQGLIPYKGNPNYDCGAWKCRHQLFDKDGNVWANQQQVSEFDPDQPRDDAGRFSATGGGGGSGGDEGGGGAVELSGTNTQEAHNYFRPQYQEWVDGLPEDEIQAIQNFANGNFSGINSELRGGFEPDINGSAEIPQKPIYDPNSATNILFGDLPSDQPPEGSTEYETSLDKTVLGIDNAIDTAPRLKEDIVLYRAIGAKELSDNALSGKLEAGTEITDLAYQSTSPTKKVGFHFAQKSDPVVYQITAKKGAKGIYIAYEGLAGHIQEAEYLLPRGSKFTVTGVHYEVVDDYKLPIIEVIYE